MKLPLEAVDEGLGPCMGMCSFMSTHPMQIINNNRALHSKPLTMICVFVCVCARLCGFFCFV